MRHRRIGDRVVLVEGSGATDPRERDPGCASPLAEVGVLAAVPLVIGLLINQHRIHLENRQ